MTVSLLRRLFTTKEFRTMTEAVVFQEDERLELVDGEILVMPRISSRHAACVRKLNLLLRSVGDRAFVDVQNPLGISEDNDFYPDVVLIKPRADNYVGEVPDANDAILVIEVADTTLKFDRSVKKPRYAAAGAPELWIVDLEGSRVWVHRKPLEGDYGEVFEARPGDLLKVPGMPDVEIPVAELVSYPRRDRGSPSRGLCASGCVRVLRFISSAAPGGLPAPRGGPQCSFPNRLGSHFFS